jgi:phage pi2 protein 07
MIDINTDSANKDEKTVKDILMVPKPIKFVNIRAKRNVYNTSNKQRVVFTIWGFEHNERKLLYFI